MGVCDGFSACSSVQVGVNHLADDGPRSDDGDFHHQVVESTWLHAGEGRHLGAAFDLEDAHRVGLLDHLIGVGVIGGQSGQIDFDAFVAPDQRDRFFQSRQHAQAQEVDLDDALVGAVFFVPLDHATARHLGRLDRDHLIESIVCDHDAAAVLSQMTGKAPDGLDQLQEMSDPGSLGIHSGFFQSCLDIGGGAVLVEAGEFPG